MLYIVKQERNIAIHSEVFGRLSGGEFPQPRIRMKLSEFVNRYRRPPVHFLSPCVDHWGLMKVTETATLLKTARPKELKLMSFGQS